MQDVAQVSELPELPVKLSTFRSDSGNLDLIRSVAVLSVFFAHLYDISQGGSDSLLGWHLAQIGVLVFFVHTSMVLMLSLERTQLSGKALVEAFYIRRFFRIYPLAMFCVTVAFILHRSPEIAAPVRHWKWTEYLSNMALTTNLTYTDIMVGGLWTLPIEVQMYLALPFLFWLGRRRGGLLAVLWMVSVPLAILQLHTSARLEVLGYAPCFIAGVIAWRLSLQVRRRVVGAFWPLGFAACFPVFFIANHENNMYFRWAFCLALGLVIPWFQEIPFLPVRTGTHFIAKYSYGIYLSHIAVILWSLSLPVPTVARWTILAILAVACPVAMYHLIEHPMILLGQRLIASRSGSGTQGRP